MTSHSLAVQRQVTEDVADSIYRTDSAARARSCTLVHAGAHRARAAHSTEAKACRLCRAGLAVSCSTSALPMRFQNERMLIARRGVHGKDIETKGPLLVRQTGLLVCLTLQSPNNVQYRLYFLPEFYLKSIARKTKPLQGWAGAAGQRSAGQRRAAAGRAARVKVPARCSPAPAHCAAWSLHGGAGRGRQPLRPRQVF